LKATELVFAEEGSEWTSIQGFTPEYWNDVLDRLRSKLTVVPGPDGS
jgi:hypothetical protein